jgi:hypothetical protein
MALHWLDGLKAATVVDLPASRDALRIYLEQEQLACQRRQCTLIMARRKSSLDAPAPLIFPSSPPLKAP